jgi:hypothetical protein
MAGIVASERNRNGWSQRSRGGSVCRVGGTQFGLARRDGWDRVVSRALAWNVATRWFGTRNGLASSSGTVAVGFVASARAGPGSACRVGWAAFRIGSSRRIGLDSARKHGAARAGSASRIGPGMVRSVATGLGGGGSGSRLGTRWSGLSLRSGLAGGGSSPRCGKGWIVASAWPGGGSSPSGWRGLGGGG